MLKKVSKILIALFAVLFVSVACSLFAVSETALADGGVVVEMTSTLTEIKSSEPNKEFTVSAKVKNPAGSELFGGQITIEFDVAVFEYVDVVKNTALKTSDIDRSTQAQKLWPQGIYTIRADQDGEPISLTEWDMGGIKLKLKNGVSPTVGAQSEIRFSECLLADMLGDDVNATFSTDSIDVSFTAASNLCELQTLSVNGQSLTGSGNTFTYNAPYSYNKLSNVVYTASQGATVTFSPELNSDLTDANTPVTITVTAEDKVTTNEYTLNVNRAAAETVNNLTSLILKNGTTQIYTKANADLLGQDLTFTVDEPVAYADRNQLSLQFNKSGSYSTVESFIDNTSKGSNTQFSLGNLASGDHTVQVKVTAQSGVTNTYTIKFTIAAADVTKTLSSLKIELLNGTPVNLTPDFSPEVFNYSATVPFGTEKVKVTATVDAPLSKITGDGEQPVNDSIKVTVKAEDGSSYTYTIVVAPEKDTSGLQLIDTKAFVVEADGITEHMLNITGTSLDNYFKITIPYQYANLTKFIIRADWGDKTYTVEGINTVMQIPESSEHRVRFVKGGVEERFIVFDIIRETNEVTLAKLTYNDVTITLTDATDYSANVAKDAKFITVVAEATDKNAKVTITSSGGELTEEGLPLEKGGDGWTLIIIKVESTAGNTGFYTLRVKKDGLVGIPWWIWLIIVALALLILILIIALIVKSKKSPQPPRTTRVQVTTIKPAGGSTYNDAELRRSLAEQEQRIKDLEDRDDGGFSDPFDFQQHR